MEASTITATAAPASPKGKLLTGPLLRLRSDEQLVRLFRGGSEEAFRVIHDRFRTRLLAYARQMLGPARADAEDVLQDVFVRAYGALRANEHEVSLRAWLYRIAHNRCIDELRRSADGSAGFSPDALELLQAPGGDPMAAVERRESLRRLVQDVQRLPEQQRSALLMRELSGMSYQDLASALDVTVPAVKSLLVRARIGLAQASEARDTACAAIRADLAAAHERGVRASGLARRHMHDCAACRAYRRELKALDTRLAALVPAVGPIALIAKLLGIGGGAGGGAAAAGGASAAAGGGAAAAAGTGVAAAGAGAAGMSASHVAAMVAVAVVGAGGAVEVHRTLAPEATTRAAVERATPAYAGAAKAAPAVLDPTAGAGAVLPGAGDASATRRGGAARSLRLRIAAPPAVTVQPATAVTAPETDAVHGVGAEVSNGGAAAPADPTLERLTPPAAVPVEPAPGETDGLGTTRAPATREPAAPPATPAPATATGAGAATTPAPPPAARTSAPDPPPATTPPTSKTTGGAAYAPPRKR